MYEDVIKRHKPRGWKIIWKKPRNKHGQWLDPDVGLCRGLVWFQKKTIYCSYITDRFMLAVFLHECGHVNLKHGLDHHQQEYAQCEYEAENYAIKAMRAEGISVPRDYLIKAKAYVDYCVRKTPNEPQTKECLKFAYGSKWRKYR